jgi:Major Facilitator Superfamily
MVVLALGLAALARVSTPTQVMVQAVTMGIAGGFVTVVFFSFWGHAYGQLHLGRIQGAAQAMTVLASAVGPLFLAVWVERTGSYAAAFYVLAGIVAVLGVAASVVPIPDGAQLKRRDSAEMDARVLLGQIDSDTAPTILDVRTVTEFSRGMCPGRLTCRSSRSGRAPMSCPARARVRSSCTVATGRAPGWQAPGYGSTASRTSATSPGTSAGGERPACARNGEDARRSKVKKAKVR